MRDGEKVETSMGGDYLQLGSKLELRHNGGLCVRACVCVCVCVCLGPFQTATMAVCTQVPNRNWGWGAVLSRQRLCHVSAAGKTAQLTLSTVWACRKIQSSCKWKLAWAQMEGPLPPPFQPKYTFSCTFWVPPAGGGLGRSPLSDVTLLDSHFEFFILQLHNS